MITDLLVLCFQTVLLAVQTGGHSTQEPARVTVQMATAGLLVEVSALHYYS